MMELAGYEGVSTRHEQQDFEEIWQNANSGAASNSWTMTRSMRETTAIRAMPYEGEMAECKGGDGGGYTSTMYSVSDERDERSVDEEYEEEEEQEEEEQEEEEEDYEAESVVVADETEKAVQAVQSQQQDQGDITTLHVDTNTGKAKDTGLGAAEATEAAEAAEAGRTEGVLSSMASIPGKLNKSFAALDSEGALRPAKIRCGSLWSLSSQVGGEARRHVCVCGCVCEREREREKEGERQMGVIHPPFASLKSREEAGRETS
jgi:hypothetical protein